MTTRREKKKDKERAGGIRIGMKKEVEEDQHTGGAPLTFVRRPAGVELLGLQLLRLCSLQLLLRTLRLHGNVLVVLLLLLVPLRSRCFLLLGAGRVWKQHSQ